MQWYDLEKKVVEIAEGRNVDSKSRGGLLTKVSLYTLTLESKVFDKVCRCWREYGLEICENRGYW